MVDKYEQLFSLLEKLSCEIDKLTEIAHEEHDAVLRSDIIGIQDCMKREQAVSLSLRSIDIKREKLLKELGLQGIPLSGLAEHCPDDKRTRARKVQKTLTDRYKLYKSASAVTVKSLELKLAAIDSSLKKAGETENPLNESGMTDIRA